MAFAFIFDSVGFGEWFVLLAVVLIVVGPKRLPATARKLGQYYAKFRRAAENFKRQLMDMDTEFDRFSREAEQQVQSVIPDEPVAPEPAGLANEGKNDGNLPVGQS